MTSQTKIARFSKIADTLRLQVKDLQAMLKEENSDSIALMIVAVQKLINVFEKEINRLNRLKD